MSKKQVSMIQHLVTVGVPGEIAAIVAAAIYDRGNLDPALSVPAGPKHALFGTVSEWVVARVGSLPATADRNEIEILLDKVFGSERPDQYGLLGL